MATRARAGNKPTLRATPAWSARGVPQDARELAFESRWRKGEEPLSPADVELRVRPDGTAVQTCSAVNGSVRARMMPSKFPKMTATEHLSVLIDGPRSGLDWWSTRMLLAATGDLVLLA